MTILVALLVILPAAASERIEAVREQMREMAVLLGCQEMPPPGYSEVQVLTGAAKASVRMADGRIEIEVSCQRKEGD